MDTQTSEVKLLPKQEKFAELYVSQEFFGNGVQTYIEVYEPDTSKPNWYKSACSAASEILSNPKVCKRINELLDAEGLNDEFVDKQLLFLITQHDDKGAKLGAMREYNKLKARIVEKSEVDNKSSDGSMTPVAAVDKSTVDELIEGLKSKTAKEAE